MSRVSTRKRERKQYMGYNLITFLNADFPSNVTRQEYTPVLSDCKSIARFDDVKF